MGEMTKIEWCDHTFNPWRGCSKVSAGCANCYAERQSRRNPATLGVWGDGGTRVVASEAMWRQPVRWNREAETAGERRRVFCGSLMDVFEDRAELAGPRDRLFDLIGGTPWLDWLLLTKRPENIAGMIWPASTAEIPAPTLGGGDYLPNVWLGVSVEDQASADARIQELLKVPAAKRFVSYEPALGPISFRWATWHDYEKQIFERRRDPETTVLADEYDGLRGIDWVIFGGESGPKARCCDIEWARSARDQCQAAGVAFFMKQMGTRPIAPLAECFSDETDYDNLDDYPIDDRKGGDPSEWPEDLRVREWPYGQGRMSRISNTE